MYEILFSSAAERSQLKVHTRN